MRFLSKHRRLGALVGVGTIAGLSLGMFGLRAASAPSAAAAAVLDPAGSYSFSQTGFFTCSGQLTLTSYTGGGLATLTFTQNTTDCGTTYSGAWKMSKHTIFMATPGDGTPYPSLFVGTVWKKGIKNGTCEFRGVLQPCNWQATKTS